MWKWKSYIEDRVLHRRQTADCPTGTYTAKDGLDFKMYCDQNLVGSDIGWVQEDSVTACMERCSSLRPLCYGVAFDDVDSECWLKDENVTLKNLTASDRTQSAAVNPLSQVQSLNTTCPYPANSYQNAKDGMEFEILCDQDMGYGDYCPVNTCGHHTETLEECMDLCSESHPLCAGVAWNPDLVGGYINCYLKNDLSGGTPGPNPNAVTHSAIARLPQANVSCPSNTTYTASDNKNFNLSCNSARLGSSNTSYHDTHLDNCIDTCATNSSGSCLGIVFDASMQSGYENCYLLNSTGEPTSDWNSTFAIFTSLNNNTSSPSRSGSKSEAWIAGPVIGGIAVIVLLAGFLFWRRKRSARRSNATSNDIGSIPVHASSEISEPQDHTKPREKAYLLHELHNQRDSAHEMRGEGEEHELEAHQMHGEGEEHELEA